MNERIKEIMLQATFYANNEFYQDKPLEESWTKLFGEKFAELLVRECALVADNDRTLRVGKAIKEHFGVEE